MNAEETPKECPGHTTYSQAKTELLVAAESRLTLLLSRLEELAKTWEGRKPCLTESKMPPLSGRLWFRPC
jgi:hypothetical protein